MHCQSVVAVLVASVGGGGGGAGTATGMAPMAAGSPAVVALLAAVPLPAMLPPVLLVDVPAADEPVPWDPLVVAVLPNSPPLGTSSALVSGFRSVVPWPVGMASWNAANVSSTVSYLVAPAGVAAECWLNDKVEPMMDVAAVAAASAMRVRMAPPFVGRR
jgi:hypothetical protein